jgi:hypothetical protein
VGPVLYGLMLTILVASLVYAFVGLRHGRLGIPLAGIAMGLLTFPMIFIHNPGATYWLDGRYGVDFGMLAIPLVFSTAAALAANGSKRAARSLHASRHARRDRGRRHIVGAGAAAVVLGCLVTGVGAQPALTIPRPGLGAFASGWTGVNSTQREPGTNDPRQSLTAGCRALGSDCRARCGLVPAGLAVFGAQPSRSSQVRLRRGARARGLQRV